jgi:hypothetical protein
MVGPPVDLAGISKDIVSELSVLNYQVRMVRFDLIDDTVEFKLASYFSYMPNISVSVRHYKHFTNTVVQAKVLSLRHELTVGARRAIDALVRNLAAILENKLEGERRAKANERTSIATN